MATLDGGEGWSGQPTNFSICGFSVLVKAFLNRCVMAAGVTSSLRESSAFDHPSSSSRSLSASFHSSSVGYRSPLVPPLGTG